MASFMPPQNVQPLRPQSRLDMIAQRIAQARGGLTPQRQPQQPAQTRGTISPFFQQYLSPEQQQQLQGMPIEKIVDLIADNPGFFGANNNDYKFYGKGVLHDGRYAPLFNPAEGIEANDLGGNFGRHAGYYSRKGYYNDPTGVRQANMDNVYARSFSPDFTSRPYTVWGDKATGGIGIRRYGGGSTGLGNFIGGAIKGALDNPLKTAALGAGLYFGLPALGNALGMGGAAAGTGATGASVSPWALQSSFAKAGYINPSVFDKVGAFASTIGQGAGNAYSAFTNSPLGKAAGKVTGGLNNMGWLDFVTNFPSVGINDSKSSSSSQPWAGHAPYLMDVWNMGQAGFSDPNMWPEVYQGDRAAGASPLQRDAFNMIRDPNYWDRGMNPAEQLTGSIPAALRGLMNVRGPADMSEVAAGGRQLMNPDSTGLLTDVAGGKFLPGGEGANPYLDDTFNMASDRLTENFEESVLPSLNAAFSGAGRSYGGAHGLAAGKAATGHMRSLEDLATRIYGDAYRDEREHQMDAAGTLGNQQLTAGLGAGNLFESGRQRELQALQSMLGGGVDGANIISSLLGRRADSTLEAGRQQRQIEQDRLDAAKAKHDEEQNQYWDMLNRYASLVFGSNPTESRSRTESEGWSLG